MTHETTPPGSDAPLPEALRWQLRTMRQDVQPANDLWPGIAARLAEPQARAAAPTAHWRPAFAVAATVVLAVASVALLSSRYRPEPPDTTALRAAQTLEAEYRDAFRSLGSAPSTDPIAPAVSELDRSARQIRRALDRDPDSRLLLEQLRRTYALRLALSQRALAG
ncbi:hypothetical protein [Lysobacter humi (ex Lee et al. 2017)]